MTKEEKLLSLLQPKDYISKIKLFCRDKKISENIVEKVCSLNNYSYLAKQINIEEV